MTKVYLMNKKREGIKGTPATLSHLLFVRTVFLFVTVNRVYNLQICCCFAHFTHVGIMFFIPVNCPLIPN